MSSMLTRVLVPSVLALLAVAHLSACGGSDASAGASTAGSGGASGGTCAVVSDCPGADTACQKRTCEQGACGAAFAAVGTACSEDGGTVCDGNGACTLCAPGEEVACYDGPAPTAGVGLCKQGTKTCDAAGASFGPCLDQVVPAVENCAIGGDEDCNGSSEACTGATTWAEAFAGENVWTFGSAVDAAGNAIFGGIYTGSLDLGGTNLTSGAAGDAWLAKVDPAGNLLRATSFGDGAGADVWAIACDATGNIFLALDVQGTLDFGGATITSAGDSDLGVAKLDPDGKHLWSKAFGDAATQYAEGIAVDADGGVVLCGEHDGTIDFGGGLLVSAGGFDGYLAKLDGTGQHVWSKSFGSAVADEGAYSVAVAADGAIAVTGPFNADTDFGGGLLTNAGGGDVFVAKLGADGEHLWSKGFGDAGMQWGTGVRFDPSGNVIVIGINGGSLDFGGGTLTSAGGDDVFIAKLDAMGAHVWSKGLGASGTDRPNGLALDPFGNVGSSATPTAASTSAAERSASWACRRPSSGSSTPTESTSGARHWQRPTPAVSDPSSSTPGRASSWRGRS
jgi:hypothetical protein